ncbi:hypothetical protein HPP92_003578 [Vanilla planifolia]|uniref:Uncharacterized protein n=1 Tax=Vanilla planifolia TaxID=51239 RepID=A0A835SC48_VANPL|nr:hypothetical protein HPP92_003578 [Vanilla planifolia]
MAGTQGPQPLGKLRMAKTIGRLNTCPHKEVAGLQEVGSAGEFPSATEELSLFPLRRQLPLSGEDAANGPQRGGKDRTAKAFGRRGFGEAADETRAI